MHCFFFFFKGSGDHRDLPSSPPRRSSDQAVEARAARQAVLHRPAPPRYEAVIDELAIRRLAAPPDIVRAQLDHLAFLGHEHPHISIRVLPITGRIADHLVPRSAFSIYRYPDSDDPTIVAVDTITS